MENQIGEKTMTKKQRILLASLSGLLAVIILTTIGALVWSGMNEELLEETLEKAHNYVAEQNYEAAIIEYKNLIEMDPENPDLYAELHDVYQVQGDVPQMRYILTLGIERTGATHLQYMLNMLNSSDGTRAKTENITDSPDITWNVSFKQKLDSYNFSDYKREFGQVDNSSLDASNELEVQHSNTSATFYYTDTEENSDIVNEGQKTPNAESMPEKATLSDLGVIFSNFNGMITLEQLQLMTGTKIQPELNDGKYVVTIPTDNFNLMIETDLEGNVTSSMAWNEITFFNANRNDNENTSKYSGVVIDAVSEKGVANAKYTFKSSSGEIVEGTTKTDGSFTEELAVSKYVLIIEADGYTIEEFEVEVMTGRTYSGEQFVISSELTEGTARVVLEWGAQPLDLDSYLSGEDSTGDSVWVSYRQKISKSGDRVQAELDVDDMNGNGPETITIYDLGGNYVFTVVDYLLTGTMAQYGATVKVYLPGKSPQTITLNANSGVEDIWEVCEINNGEIRIINSGGDESSLSPDNK